MANFKVAITEMYYLWKQPTRCNYTG